MWKGKIIFYFLIYPIGHLPWKVAYILADMLAFMFFYIFRYRRKIILQNFDRVFPQMEKVEKTRMLKGFYRNLADIGIESLKGFFISNEEFKHRYNITNADLLIPFYQKGQSVLVAAGHIGNWEWATMALPLYLMHGCSGIYTPLSNPYIEKKMYKTRSKNHLTLIPKKESNEYLLNRMKHPEAVFFLIDQSPSSEKKAYWLEFLGVNTPVQFGLEKYAKELNTPVLFLSVYRKERGYYDLTFEMVTEHPDDEEYGNIMNKSYASLEKAIIRCPQDWLWSHRRWKLMKKI